jgi:hypothetical protein
MIRLSVLDLASHSICISGRCCGPETSTLPPVSLGQKPVVEGMAGLGNNAHKIEERSKDSQTNVSAHR